MTQRRNKRKNDETLLDLVDAKESAQSFIEKNQLVIIAVIAGLILLVGGYLAYKYVYMAPKEKQAMEQIHKAEFQFKQDSFALALENPGGGYDGFLDIVDNYNGTKAANISKYYAGICYLNLGRYDSAIEYLNSYSAKDDVTKITKFGALGDAYSELNEFDKAITNYSKAANNGNNELLNAYYLKKLGMLYSKQGDADKATSTFKKIVELYPSSTEATDVDKYLK